MLKDGDFNGDFICFDGPNECEVAVKNKNLVGEICQDDIVVWTFIYDSPAGYILLDSFGLHNMRLLDFP